MENAKHFILGFLGAAFIVMALSASANADDTKPATTKKAGGPTQIAEKYDTKLPIEISSDTLEVLQQENRAIFKGNVIAVQGKIRLTSDVMIVHYKQQQSTDKSGAVAAKSPEPKPAPATAPAASSAQGSMGAITLIEVEGNVFVATPEESAKGDKGNYQVNEKLLHLTGDNVILTRDKNILRGTALVYNLETGRSLLTNNGKQVGDANGGRVRGVFIPNEDQSNKNKPKDKAKENDKTGATVTPPTPGGTSAMFSGR